MLLEIKNRYEEDDIIIKFDNVESMALRQARDFPGGLPGGHYIGFINIVMTSQNAHTILLRSMDQGNKIINKIRGDYVSYPKAISKIDILYYED